MGVIIQIEADYMHIIQKYNLWLGIIISLCFLFFSPVLKASGDESGTASAIGSSIVLDPDGKEYRLGDAWETKPVVLVFIRHFG